MKLTITIEDMLAFTLLLVIESSSKEVSEEERLIAMFLCWKGSLNIRPRGKPNICWANPSSEEELLIFLWGLLTFAPLRILSSFISSSTSTTSIPGKRLWVPGFPTIEDWDVSHALCTTGAIVQNSYF